jgi:hypothetical protein
MNEDVTDSDRLSAFGLSFSVAGPRPPGAWEPRPRSEPALALEIDTPEAIDGGWSGRQALEWEAAIDGAPFTVERGRAGDHRFVHRGRAVHHLSADAALLRCAPRDEQEPGWWRVVLDSVLFSVALLSGFEALHAGAVVTPSGALAVTGGPGAGKSTLIAELLGRGLPLLSDDVVVLEAQQHGAPLAHPGPPLMTLPEGAGAGLGVDIDIGRAGDERWVAVPAHAQPAPLATLVALERRPTPGTGVSLRRIDAPLATLIGALLGFPRLPERERARFELASVLASHTALWRLRADPGVDPAALATILLADLPGLARSREDPH